MKTCMDPKVGSANVNADKLFPIPGFDQYRITRTGRIWSTFGNGRWLRQNLTPDGYLRVNLYTTEGPVRVFVARLMGAAFLGLDLSDSKTFIDHANRIKTDNRLDNLRLATRAQNQCNVPGRKRSTNRSGKWSRFVGVSWDQSRGKWQAGITVAGRKKNLGRFSCEKEAARAYDQAAVVTHGEFANLNAV